MRWTDINFDGLVGPTHNYAGLAFGNVASEQHQGEESNPRQAALQGLAKMRWLMNRGFQQGIFPPQLRPDLMALRRFGFRGSGRSVLAQAWEQAPQLFAMCCSASSMWVANGATIIPSCDSADKRCVLVPANLVSHVHRSLEVPQTVALLKSVFSDKQFRVESPLLSVAAFSDEGAANHLRLSTADGASLHLFIYGHSMAGGPAPKRFPARQTREACAALARFGGLSAEQFMLVQQNPEAIDAGVFHNDVIAVSHDNILLCHEKAFLDQPSMMAELRRRSSDNLCVVEVLESEIPLSTAVNTYLFNSQILGDKDNRILLLPVECERDGRVKAFVETRLRAELSLAEIVYMDLQESMRNGGGPACLRLRLPLNSAECSALQGTLLLTDERYERIAELVETRYPTSLRLEQLAHWDVATEMRSIVVDIYKILGLPDRALYGFEE